MVLRFICHCLLVRLQSFLAVVFIHSGSYQAQLQLGDGSRRDLHRDGTARRLQVFDLWSHFVFLIESIVGVKIGIGQHGHRRRLYRSASNRDFRLADFVHAWVHQGEYQILAVQRCGTLQSPKRRWLAIARVLDVWGGDDGAHRLPSLVSAVHSENMAHRSYAEFIFVSKVKTVQTINQLRRTGERDFFRMAVEDIEGHRAEYGVSESGSLLKKVAGSELTAGAIPKAPLVHHELYLMRLRQIHPSLANGPR